MAGVINYVLRKDFKGAEFSGSYGDSTAASNESRIDLSGVFGAKLGDQHFMLVVDYYKRDPFYLRDRAVSANSFRPSQQGFYPSFNDLYLQNLDQTESPQNGGCPAANFGMGNLGDYARSTPTPMSRPATSWRRSAGCSHIAGKSATT